MNDLASSLSLCLTSNQRCENTQAKCTVIFTFNKSKELSAYKFRRSPSSEACPSSEELQQKIQCSYNVLRDWHMKVTKQSSRVKRIILRGQSHNCRGGAAAPLARVGDLLAQLLYGIFPWRYKMGRPSSMQHWCWPHQLPAAAPFDSIDSLQQLLQSRNRRTQDITNNLPIIIDNGYLQNKLKWMVRTIHVICHHSLPIQCST